MEPQPLNFQVRQLERELGFRLLGQRDGKTHLTAAGESFARDVEGLLTATEQAVDRAARIARGEAGTLRVAVPSHLATPLLAEPVKAFHANHPDASFQIRQMSWADQIDALHRAQLDLGIGILPPDDPHLDGRAIARARPLVAVAASDELATLPEIPWAALQGRPALLLDPEESGLARRWLDDMLAAHDVRVGESQAVPDTESAVALAGFGFGMAILLAPDIMLLERPGVAFIPLPNDAGEIDVSAMWLRGEEHVLRDAFVDMLTPAGTAIA